MFFKSTDLNISDEHMLVVIGGTNDHLFFFFCCNNEMDIYFNVCPLYLKLNDF